MSMEISFPTAQGGFLWWRKATHCNTLLQHAAAVPPKMREIALWSSTNGAIVHFLVLPGSLWSITEITEYKYLVYEGLSVN